MSVATAWVRSGTNRWAWLLALSLAVSFLTVPSAHSQASKDNRAAVKAASGPVPASIDRNGVLILVRSTLLALDHANRTGNYTVLRDLGSPGFQTNTAAKLAEIFASQRSQGLDLGGIAVLEPQLTVLPQIETNGMLHMAGFFPSAPLQVSFELLFEPVNRQWKIFGISVKLNPGGPQAPDQPVADQPKPAEPSPEAPSPAIGANKKTKSAKPLNDPVKP